MNLNHSVREISYNKFVVVNSEGVDVSQELDLEVAADLVRRFENAARTGAGEPLLTAEDMPAILAELTGHIGREAWAAHLAHVGCKNCMPGRFCSESMRLFEAQNRASNWTRAEFATINRWGVRQGHHSAEVALATIGFNGGKIIKAPEGSIEACLAKQAEEKAARDEAFAARKAAGFPNRRRAPRRW